MSETIILKEKLFTLRKDKNDLYYIDMANIKVWRLLEKWSEVTRDYTTRHPKEDMVHILKFVKLYEIEFELETELWLEKNK